MNKSFKKNYENCDGEKKIIAYIVLLRGARSKRSVLFLPIPCKFKAFHTSDSEWFGSDGGTLFVGQFGKIYNG